MAELKRCKSDAFIEPRQSSFRSDQSHDQPSAYTRQHSSSSYTKQEDDEGLSDPTCKTAVTGKGLFVCPAEGCGKIFDRQYGLRVHFRKHSGERPYSCDLCHKTFRWRSSASHHRATHHPGEPKTPIVAKNYRTLAFVLRTTRNLVLNIVTLHQISPQLSTKIARQRKAAMTQAKLHAMVRRWTLRNLQCPVWLSRDF